MDKKMNKLSKMINELDADELMLIKKDLDAGNIQALLNQRINEKKERDWNKVCPVCHTPLDENEGMMLTFGPKDLRKRASFCAPDCLEYFLQRSREQKKEINID
jgi:hypothetical protein